MLKMIMMMIVMMKVNFISFFYHATYESYDDHGSANWFHLFFVSRSCVMSYLMRYFLVFVGMMFFIDRLISISI